MQIFRRIVSLLALLFVLMPASGFAQDAPVRVAVLYDVVGWGSRMGFGESWGLLLRNQLGDGHEVRWFGDLNTTLAAAADSGPHSILGEVEAYRPDVVIVALGSVDAIGTDTASLEPACARLVSGLQRIVTDPDILLCTPTDVVPSAPHISQERAAILVTRQARLVEIRRAIVTVAQKAASQKVRLIDLYGVTHNRPDQVVAGDGVQLSELGHGAIAEILLSAVRELHREPAVPTTRPNIILFLVDDLGWQDCAVPMHTGATALNARYRTPHLEQLAARGMKFTNAYASAPVCTPTRTSILTGKAPARTHITYWTLDKDADTSTPRDDIAPPAWAVNGLQPGDHETLPEILIAAGYRTIHVGKAHFGTHGTPGGDPKSLGFLVNIAGHASGGPASYYGLDHFTLAGRQGKPPHSSPSVWDIPGLEKYHGHDIYLTEALAIEACGAIRESVAAGEPFYLNFAPYAVHAPIMGNKKYEPNYPDLDERERAYASMIETYDAALGALVTTLEETGQLGNTVIIFSGDNGGLSAHARGAAPDGETQHTHNAPLKSGKGSAYEGGTRVPTVIVWPGVTDMSPSRRAVEVCDVPVVSHDLFPTVIALAGLQADDASGDGRAGIDGRDLTPLLTGRAELFDADRVLGWNQPHQWGASGPGIEPFTSARAGDWKLIYFHAGRRFELYNLAADIGEASDLAPAMPAKVAELAAAMDKWLDDTGAQLSIDKATGEEIERPGAAAARLGGLPVTCIPAPSAETRSQAAGWGERGWMQQFEDIRGAAGSLEPRLVLIGDSITQGWAGPGRQVGGAGAAARERHLDALGPVLNAGISGDRTQHVLWRLRHGMLDGCEPGAVVLMIGTNNLPDDEPEAIAAGVGLILAELRGRVPGARVVLVSCPPRGARADEPLRLRGSVLNARLASLADGDRVRWLDLTPLLTDETGAARADRMAGDFVHFSPGGYEAVGSAIGAAVAEVIRPGGASDGN
ncbi:MAG: sulfatase-like hydrolase/transferase [Phycisphaerales bacterium]|nr:sulfatase-like hydrolase/transferase [Phycisphaerales bacterium]